MIGKKNIVFGFFFFVFTAALGPYMIVKLFPAYGQAQAAQGQAVGALQLLKGSGYSDPQTLAQVDPFKLARLDTDAILAMSATQNAKGAIDSIKGGAHTHGNLESLLNIVVGFLLAFVAVGRWFKQIISWAFLLGAVLHSGMLYLSLLGVSWAGLVLGTGVGPILILIGLLLMALATAIGYRGESVRDSFL
ncbi:MAG: hypothetical protein P8Y64_05640 [Gammaproteobacteria bacterium]|jgi:uncharacterized membrane protein YgdD (TMEM256/DUF423 family)